MWSSASLRARLVLPCCTGRPKFMRPFRLLGETNWPLGRRRFSSSDDFCNNRTASAINVESRCQHKPVLVAEVLEVIRPKPQQVILDMTFGAGGHTRSILEYCPDVTVYALDRDPVAFNHAQKLSKQYPQVIPLLGRFSEVQRLLSQMDIHQVDVVLFDLGASSMQYDCPERGFSISRSGPLDMRMEGNHSELTAADVVNFLTEDGLFKIIKKYGEEKKAQIIARTIVDSRNTYGRITTTTQLADIVANVYQGMEHKQDKLGRHSHVATKTFQALRIFVNDELNEVYNGLVLAHALLPPGGLCTAISFHSLEDRIVKRHFHGIDMDAKANMSVTDRYRDPSVTHGKTEVERLLSNRWQPVSRRSIVPTEEETQANPRARSAKMRAAVRV